MWKVSGSGILTGTNPLPHTFAAERSFSPSPCPPLHLIPPSWSAPAAWSFPSSPSLASLWWGREGREKKSKSKKVIYVHNVLHSSLIYLIHSLSVMIHFFFFFQVSCLFPLQTFPLTHSPSSQRKRGERKVRGELSLQHYQTLWTNTRERSNDGCKVQCLSFISHKCNGERPRGKNYYIINLCWHRLLWPSKRLARTVNVQRDSPQAIASVSGFSFFSFVKQ